MKSTILVLTSTYPRDSTDHEPRFVADLCEELSSFYNIVVLTQHRPGSKFHEFLEGVEVIRFRYGPEKLEILSETGGILNTLTQNPVAWLMVPVFLIAQIFATRKLIRKSDIRLIHAHWLIPQVLVAHVCQVFMGNRVAVVSTAHGGDIYGLRRSFFTWIKRHVIRASASLCVVSNSMKDFAINNLAINSNVITVCPMGADLTGTFVPSTATVRKPGQLLFVGRLVEKKGVKFLIQALKELRENGHEYFLQIVGYGPGQEELCQLISKLELTESVSITGSLTHSELAQMYQEAEVCVLPYVRSDSGDLEGLPITVIEAMGCRCPVVVGDVPGIEDLVKNGQTGFLCSPSEPGSIAAKIRKMSRDQANTEMMAGNALKHVRENFSWEVCANRYSRVFEALMPENEAIGHK